MKLQVLLSVMHQIDHSVMNKSNIQSDAIVVNQSDEFKKETIKHNNSTIQFLTFDERGVGLSRNNALMRASADIVLMADDDVVYTDDYENLVLDEFRSNPQADMIVFNVPGDNLDRPNFIIRKRSRVRRYNCLRYGTYRMAFRLDSIRAKNINFSLLFGGGAKYSSGEDSIFIYDAVKKGLKVYAVPVQIGTASQSQSTWFRGYTDKFFKDKGALFASISPRLAYLLAIQFVVRKYQTFTTDLTFWQIIKLLMAGIREIKR